MNKPVEVLDPFYERLKEEIFSARLAPGSPLPELELAERYGISRTPVREALQRLEHDGLAARSGRGLVVRERSPEEILEIHEARIVLEAAVAVAAAERHTTTDRVRLEALQERLERLDSEADGTVRAKENLGFHEATWRASHNTALIDLLERLSLHLLRYPTTTLVYPGRWDDALQEHKELLAAIFRRDAEGAAAASRKHFTHARDIRIRMWEQSLRGPDA